MIDAPRSIAELPSTPWRNGGGVTRDLATGPPSSEAGEPGWRISVATVTDGAVFSPFPGYARTFIPLDGGITLVGPDGALPAGPDGAVAFDGAVVVHARVTGDPALALNVMVRAEYRAWVRSYSADGAVRCDAADVRATVVIEGEVMDAAGRPVNVPAVVPPRHPITVRSARLLDVVISDSGSGRDSPIDPTVTDRTTA